MNRESQDLRSLFFDYYGVSNRNDASRGLSVNISQGDSDVEGHVWLNQVLVCFIDDQSVLLDVAPDLHKGKNSH